MFTYVTSLVLCVALLILYVNQASLESLSNVLFRYVSRRVNSWKFLFSGVYMITAGYKKAGGKAFEVPGPDHNHIFVSSKEHLGEVRKAGRDELSMFGATKQMFQPAYTMLGHNWLDERGAEGIGYVRAVGTLFPRQLLNIMPDMQRIIRESFEAFLETHTSQEGTGIAPAYKMNKKILTKLNGFCFFGDELSQNEEFMEKIFEYNELVITAAEILRVLPEFLKGIIGPYIGRHTSVQEKIFNMINGLVTRRMEEKKLVETGEISSSPPNDMIQWIIDTAPANLEWGPRRITYEIIAIWFGSVHALSATVTYVLFDLCAHPEYVGILRKEVESSAFDEFMKTTKGLPLLDSFIKESSRLNPIEAMSGRRQALRDFEFSDGTQVKKGDWTCVPTRAMLHDETYYPHATAFEGFRFAPPDKVPKDERSYIFQPEGPSRYSDLSDNYHAWGIGGIVCPGRFYSSVATKLILAHILKGFECSFMDQHTEMTSIWRSYSLPREDVLVQFSPRLE
ncbi:cytochrome P450 [Annulohypoxylon maeteangense]|uniref:cytochrome P450 n=1 Tax=Annulohypoxylon maeteangense TaxID=1927788 RepID=UPI00200788FB|nr:cytochrome P450 [Annulohypoxylon maeteangense]KAI0890679.1 cytochrome P450 [Annulohypoxylon maeteangense]